jgi:uncharacterized membrane protein SpoIIM required for sporulation
VSEARFVRQNQRDWRRLEEYEARLDGTGAGLSGQELFAFVSLYRKVTGDLARARTLRLRPDLVDYLNGLVGRLHLKVYAAPPYPARRILDFYAVTLPATVRRLWRHVAASAALLFVPALLAWVAVSVNPHLSTAFVPAGFAEQLDQMYGKGFDADRPAGAAAFMTSFYIVNNIQVSFWAFALGIFLGLGSASVLAFNGMVLGGVATLVHEHGHSSNFWSFVASHGGIELGAIVISGAAGLRIGLSLVNPGMLARRDALVEASKDAGLLMFGVMTMLVLAAGIEAWISPSPLPREAKWTLGVVNLVAVLAYFAVAGRRVRRSGDVGEIRG